MALSLLSLPELSEADPQLAGEGTLDPVGLAPIADRLAELLVPGVRSRMQRIRFLTAAAVGAQCSSDLIDSSMAEGGPTPSIAFEWIVLEAFARRDQEFKCLSEPGVAGSAKVRQVVLKAKGRLDPSNYLKAPNVFGFTGVYLPLARDFGVLKDDRRAGRAAPELVRAWEQDQGLEGFTDLVAGTPGRQFAEQLRKAVSDSMAAGQCAAPLRNSFLDQICETMHPGKIGDREGQLLRDWLESPDQAVRSELAQSVLAADGGTEQEVFAQLLARGPSPDVERRLQAIVDFERFARTLLSGFDQLRALSTAEGSKPITTSGIANDPILKDVVKMLPGLYSVSYRSISDLDPLLAEKLTSRFQGFADPLSVEIFVSQVLSHHDDVQGRKPPGGKRPWFERQGNGWVIRRDYRFDVVREKSVDVNELRFIHPYRMSAMSRFMDDLQS
jgi:hypothetical protein